MRICNPLEASASNQARVGILRTAGILAKRSGHSDSAKALLLNEFEGRTTIATVDFVAGHLLPFFKYLFFAGLIGAVPVIIITAIKTAQSMLEEDDGARDHSAQ